MRRKCVSLYILSKINYGFKHCLALKILVTKRKYRVNLGGGVRGRGAVGLAWGGHWLMIRISLFIIYAAF